MPTAEQMELFRTLVMNAAALCHRNVSAGSSHRAPRVDALASRCTVKAVECPKGNCYRSIQPDVLNPGPLSAQRKTNA